MDDFCAKIILALALASAAAPAHVLADAGDDQYAVAAGHYARDRWKLAIEEFQALRRDFPEHPKAIQALFFQAEAHMQQREYADAQKLFREFVESDPKSRYRRQAQFRVGESLYLSGKAKEARDELEAFLAEHSDDALNAFVLCYLGELELGDKQWSEAKTLFERCLKAFPSGQMQDDCRFGLAQALRELGEHEDARRLYLALSSKSGSPLADDALFRLAALHYDQGEYESSLATLADFEKSFPDSKLRDRVRLSQGWTLYRLERYAEAQQIFEGLAGRASVAIEARHWLGLAQKAQKQWSAAAKTLLSLAKEHPAHELIDATRYHAGDASRLSGEFDSAAEAFRAVLDDHAESAWADDAHVGLLQVAWQRRDHIEVDQLAQRFAKKFAKSALRAEVDRVRSQSLLARSNFAEAAKVLESLSQRPDRDAAQQAADAYSLALAYQGLNRTDEALELLEPLTQAGEGDLANDALQVQATLLISEERFAAAIGPLTTLLHKRPDGEAADRCRAQLAVCYARTQDLPKARSVWQGLVDRKAHDALVHAATQHLAEAYYAAAEYARAAELFGRLTADDLPADVAAKGLSGAGWSQYRLEQWAPAAAAFGRLIENHPKHALAAESILVRGQICEKLSQPDEALRMYELLIEMHPEATQRSQAMLAAARIEDRKNDNQAAAAHYAQLLEEYPEEAFVDAALYEQAWLLRELDQPQEALDAFQRLHKAFPDSRFWADATFRLAEHAYGEKDFAEADRWLTALVKRHPDQAELPHVLFMQGQIAAGSEDWPAAAIAMQRLVDSAPEHALRPLAEYWAAEAKYRQGDRVEAGRRLKQLAERTGDKREPWMAMIALRRAQILAEQKEWKQAQQLAERIGEDFAGFDQQYEADYVIGRAMASRGEFEAARAAYQRVVRSEVGGKTETAARAQWMIGESFFHQKNYDAALREYLRVEILYAYPEWQAAALLQAGKCQEHLGQWKQAAELYDRLVREFSETSFVAEAQRRQREVLSRLAQDG